METPSTYGKHTTIRPDCLHVFSAWQQPNPEEVQAVLKLAHLNAPECAKLIGVSPSEVQNWLENKTSIPYAAWALLCHKAGFGIIWL